MTSPPDVAAAVPMCPMRPSPEPSAAGPASVDEDASHRQTSAPPVLRSRFGVPMTTTPSANAKWSALSVSWSPAISSASVMHIVVDTGTPPWVDGMEVNSSPHVLFTAASRSPSEACTAAPNALFTFAPGPRPSEFSNKYVAAVYVCALVPDGDASARSARSVATSPGMLPNLIDAALSGSDGRWWARVSGVRSKGGANPRGALEGSSSPYRRSAWIERAT